ncbi:MAG: hypothetical protein JW817_04425 [Clostridiales bacterium]|nr:hypothetical protein [Clostridiales bacterium]
MAKMTRLATTVTARYFPSTELTDAFYMDGRLTGKRESRSADITTDKEDRGFFFSVFSHATIGGQDPNSLPPYEPALRKLYNDVKSGRKTLDDQIGELVNTAVSVTGRLKIQAENSRSPFFAGAIVKDSEAFAITLGKGLAFLYRDDTLFPMTATDIKIDPVNTQRQKVDRFYNYCATKTATALCSNIAQLRVDDCIILCNREVYDALGQHELLRILYDAEDQCEAAGNVITEAAAKLPNVPLQFMISFVENVSAPEKGGFFGFGRKKNQQVQEADTFAPVEDVPVVSEPAPIPTPVVVPSTEPVEPLFFGNEPTDPTAEPLAEKPVTPPGPEDPIQFIDESMKPFGAPGSKTEPETDEGGFIKTGDESAEDAELPKTDEPNAKSVEEKKEDHSDADSKDAADITATEKPSQEEWTPIAVDLEDKDEVQVEKATMTESVKSTEPQEDFEVMKAFAPEDDWTEIPVAPTETASSVPENQASDTADGETEIEMGNFDFEGKDTPRYIPDDEDEENTPLLFGDDEGGESNEEPEYFEEGSFTDFSEDQIPLGDTGYYGDPEATGQADGYYIPFDSTQPPASMGTAGQDIPEIPLYDAPSYQPSTYFDDERVGSAYDQAEAYSRGSFDISEEDGDIRRDYPPRPASVPGADYSYGIPPAAPTGSQPPRRSTPRPEGGPRGPQGTGRKPRSGDPFEQERGFDYGERTQKFKRNNLYIYGLAGLCLILLIVLIGFGIKSCVDDGKPEETKKTEQTTDLTTEPQVTAEPTDPGQTTDPVNIPGTEAIGIFEFSDATGYRTWWDLFNKVYEVKIESITDSRIATIISYNNLPADYVPKTGDQILLPPTAMITTPTETTVAP